MLVPAAVRATAEPAQYGAVADTVSDGVTLVVRLVVYVLDCTWELDMQE
jgi:hypothetical protein